jgi:outer membrane receptor protein involved in Fe transport
MESVCARHLAGAGFALLLTVGSAGAAGNDADALISGEQVVNERDASSRAGAPEDAGNAETPETYPSIKLPDPPETRARPARGPVLDEIIVTAQKRPQTLADVPISVTAISGEKLRDAGIENLSDLSEYAPNFKLVEGGLVPLIYMRGVG